MASAAMLIGEVAIRSRHSTGEDRKPALLERGAIERGRQKGVVQSPQIVGTQLLACPCTIKVNGQMRLAKRGARAD